MTGFSESLSPFTLITVSVKGIFLPDRFRASFRIMVMPPQRGTSIRRTMRHGDAGNRQSAILTGSGTLAAMH